MKLKNKKTGEIKEFALFDGNELQGGATLESLTKEWEDAPEEPKEHWCINEFGTPEMAGRFNRENIYDKSRKLIGNDFETKEEAEKAVEKLKAWKQLKDNCNFRFNGLERDEIGRLLGVKVAFDKAQVTFDTAKRCYEILDLLFGGEEY